MPVKIPLTIDTAYFLIKTDKIKRKDGNWHIWNEEKDDLHWRKTDKQESQLLEIVYLDVIRERLKEYHAHRNDPYAYFPEEIPAVGELKSHAVEDIAFLLEKIEQLEPK